MHWNLPYDCISAGLAPTRCQRRATMGRPGARLIQTDIGGSDCPKEAFLKNMDCIAFLQWALPQLSLSWSGFHRVRSQVCKRIHRRIDSLGLADFDAYRDHLKGHSQEWALLDRFCRITISRFYRDRNVFGVLGERILPQLAQAAAREKRDLACWSAGCASRRGLHATHPLGSDAC